MTTSRLLGLGIVLLGLVHAENVAAQAAPPQELSSQSRYTIAPAQMLKEANKSLEYMQRTKAAIEKSLKKATSKKDAMLTLALNRKLIEISNLIQTTETRIKALQAAIDRGDVDPAKHEFTVLKVYAEKAQQLNQEVAQLIGNNDDGSGGLRNSDDSEEQSVTTNTNMPGSGGGGGGGTTPPIPEPPVSPH